MKIELYMRNRSFNPISKWVLMDRCETCNSTELLEVHHEVQFIELFHNTLNLLDIEYSEYASNYTEKELELIELMLRGMQTKSKMVTLCKDCHTEEHKKYGNKVMKPSVMCPEERILSRDNKEDSIAQRIVKWFDENEGYGEIRTRDLLKLNDITQKQFDKAKERNESFRSWIASKSSKRGVYVA